MKNKYKQKIEFLPGFLTVLFFGGWLMYGFSFIAEPLVDTILNIIVFIFG